MGRASSSAGSSRQNSLASSMKSDVLAMTKDASGPSRIARETEPSMMDDLPPPAYDAVMITPPESITQEIAEIAPPRAPQNIVVELPQRAHTCLENDPLRYVPLTGLVRVALFPLSIPYCHYSRYNQCPQCGAGIGRQLTGLAIHAAKRKMAEKQAKKAAKRC